MEPDVPSAALSRLQITRSKYSFANTPPPPGLRTYTPQQLRNESFIGPPPSQSRPKQRRVKSQSTGSALVLRKTTVEEMMGRTGGGIHYDPMSDPALAGYYARKFGWTVAAQPPSGGARGAGGPARPRGSAGGRTKKKPAAKSKGSTEYTVQVVTSRKSRSASASEKTILIFGVDGKSKKILLSAPGVHFKAGATDTFHVKAGRLGDLLKVKVTNESQRRADSWHLDHVVISRGKGKTAKRWKFPCDKWLSAEEGDRKCSRTLLATKVAASKPVYDVDVYTADKRGAGTDANVFITLFGVKGQGVRTKLDDKKNNFERNMVDHFVVEPRQPLGKLTKVRIEHDNKGIAAGWCLDQIVITHRKTGNKYFFPCHKWLAKDEGDGQISRDLPVAGADGKVTATEYLVEVFTGDVRYAGTDANVTIVIVGENGDIGPKVLDNSKNNFERGKKDTFNLQSPGLGELKSVRISHDNKGVGAAWFLDKVVVTDASTGVPVVFPCNRWLAKGEDDGAISRELTPEGTWTTVPYKVHVQTSDKRWAGTSANVHCELFGKLGSSGRTKLENHKDNFQRGRTDIFVVECRDLGEITHMTIGHDNKGSGPGWHVGAVKLEAPTLGLIYPGSCDQWLAADEGDGQLEREIVFVPENAIKVAKKNVWHCAVTTSDKRNAGTDANVFMTVYGTQGKSEVIPVKSNSDTFERGKTDEFKVELDTLGVLHKLRVWHDNKGGFAGWHLSHIELT